MKPKILKYLKCKTSYFIVKHPLQIHFCFAEKTQVHCVSSKDRLIEFILCYFKLK